MAWRALGAGAFLLLVIAFGFVSARPNLVPKNFGEVDPGKVYRSGQLTPEAFRRVVEAHHIKTIIDLGSGKDEPSVEKLNASVAASLGVRRCVGALEGDGTGNPNWYVWALRLASDPANQPVLVHCGAGSERTGMLVILYKNVHMGVKIEEGYEEAKRYRHDPARNPKLKPTLDQFAPAILAAYREGRWIAGHEVPPAMKMDIEAGRAEPQP
jgi:protein tyrosine/serine phosphatase